MATTYTVATDALIAAADALEEAAATNAQMDAGRLAAGLLRAHIPVTDHDGAAKAAYAVGCVYGRLQVEAPRYARAANPRVRAAADALREALVGPRSGP